MSRKPFSKLLDWFYLHCADNHEALRTKKGMIDVAVWTMTYVLLDNLDESDSFDNMWKQFGTDFLSQHKCDGAHALFHSRKYIGPILKQRVELKSDPGFTKKELYRCHNYAESNIHRGAGKRKVGKVISQLDPSKKINPSHPSSSSNATDSDADAAIIDGGAASGAPSETPVRSELALARADANALPPKKSSTPRKGKNLNEGQKTDSDANEAIVAGGAAPGAASVSPVRSEVACADPKASPPKKSSTPRKAKYLNEGQRNDSDADEAIVAGGAASDAASDTPVRSEVACADAKASPPKKSSTPRQGVKEKEAQSKPSWIGTWHLQEQRDPSYQYSGKTLPARRESSPRLAAKAKASPSNQTVSSNISTPPIRNSKQDITQLHPTASGHGAVTTHASPDVKAASSSIEDSTSIDESSSDISKNNSSIRSMSPKVF